jgi:TonB-dependent receptor
MKPVTFTNYDLALEWYPKSGVYAYMDVFAKDIKNQDLFSAFYQTQPTQLMDLTAGTEVTVDIPWFYIQNRTTSAAEKAKIRGVEIGGRSFFDMLPAPFDGFGISGNLTYVDSENPALLANSVMGVGYVPDGVSDVPASFNPDFKKMPYYGMSTWTYNVELYYSKGPLNARVAYNWHSKQLMSTNANPLSYIGRGGSPHRCNVCVSSPGQGRIWDMVPLWSDDAGYLDFGLDYKLNDKITFGIHAANLTDTKSKTLQEPLPGIFLDYDTYVSDRRVSAFMRMRY